MSILNTTRNDMAFCPGCSHSRVLEMLSDAVTRLNLASHDVCLVSDIGCIGMADRYFETHTFHGLHGRALTYAEGIKRVRPDLAVIVLIGDGGCGIGTAHLVHAARRGMGIKVIVCNNFNFGMTGGQHSVTTPPAACTVTTPLGAVDAPFDICQTVLANGAGFVARQSATDSNVVETLEAALRAPGFALVELWELCVAYYAASNRLTPPGLDEMAAMLGMPFGILQRSAKTLPARSVDTDALAPRAAERATDKAALFAPRVPWPKRVEITVAGSAGQHIRTACGAIGEALAAGDLNISAYDDFPISVRRGHSVSTLVIDGAPVRYAGGDNPDLLILLSPDGEKRIGSLGGLRRECVVLAEQQLALTPSPAQVRRFALGDVQRAAGRSGAALALLTAGLVLCGWITPSMLVTAARVGLRGRYRLENLAAIDAGLKLATAWQQATTSDLTTEGSVR